MPNSFEHHGGGPVGPMSGPGPVGGHGHCDHPEITDYTMGANYAPIPGLPDHITYKAHINDKLKIDPASVQRVDGFFKRIKLYNKRYGIKKAINLNCRIYSKNEKKLKKLKAQEAKYKANGVITGSKVRKLNRKMAMAREEMNTAERYLNDRLYNNYLIYQRYLTGYKVEYIKTNDDYYNAHIKEKNVRQRIETLTRIRSLLEDLSNMGDLADSTKYNQILAVSNYLEDKLSDNDSKVDAALEYAEAELMKMLNEATENYSNARRRV